MKVDLVMWTKDGEKFLRQVLSHMEQVIPEKNANQKIIVDDHRGDKTVRIAKYFT